MVGFRIAGPPRPFDPREALILCADFKGGSTWLYEMLLEVDRIAGLWEPRDVGRVALFRDLGFRYREYISETACNPPSRAAFENSYPKQLDRIDAALAWAGPSLENTKTP